MTDTQWCLAQEGELKLSKYEQAYLAWAESQETKKAPSVDEAALREMCLSEEEIAFVKLMAETEEKHHTPAGCSLDDGTRYLLWNVQYFPKTDKLTGKITVQSFVDSVGVSYKYEPRKLEDYFLSIRWTVKHAIDGNYPDSALLRAYRKVLAWCLEFEKEHGLKEKGFEVMTVNSESDSAKEDKLESLEQQQEKEVLSEDSEEFEPEEMTIKQRNYLLFLMSTIRDEKIRHELQKRLCVFSKIQASRIIDALVSGNEEVVLELI